MSYNVAKKGSDSSDSDSNKKTKKQPKRAAAQVKKSKNAGS